MSGQGLMQELQDGALLQPQSLPYGQDALDEAAARLDEPVELVGVTIGVAGQVEGGAGGGRIASGTEV